MTAKNEAPSSLPVMDWPSQRNEGNKSESYLSLVPIEEPLSIEVNDRRVAILMRLPGHEKELAVGFCVSEGLIRDFQKIELVHHCGQGLPSPGSMPTDGGDSRNRVRIQVHPSSLVDHAPSEVARLIRSGCGAVGMEDLGAIGLSPVKSATSLPADVVLRLGATLREGQQTHRTAGGVHAAGAFSDEGNLIVVREDVGRHNALDKVIGHCLMHGIALQDKILLSTGRASYEMVTKAVRLGAPIVATISACTSLAIQLAEEYGVTLIGYLRGTHMTVYTHAERVLMPETASIA